MKRFGFALLSLMLAGCGAQTGAQIVWQTVEVPVTVIAVQTVQVPMTILVPVTVEVPVTVQVPVTPEAPPPSATREAATAVPVAASPTPAAPVGPTATARPAATPVPTEALPPVATAPHPFYTLARAQNNELFDVLERLSWAMGYTHGDRMRVPAAEIIVQKSRVEAARSLLLSSQPIPELQGARDLMLQAFDRLDIAAGDLLKGDYTTYLDRAYESNMEAKRILDTYHTE